MYSNKLPCFLIFRIATLRYIFINLGSNLLVNKSFKENCFATQALSQTRTTGIEPATFWSPVGHSNHWATRTQMAERRPRCVPVRKRDTRTAKQQSRYVSISYYLTGIRNKINEYIYIRYLTWGDQKVAGSIPVWGSETFSEFAIKLEQQTVFL